MNSIPADPSKWSDKSQGSVASTFTKFYEDIKYKCWSCKKASIFSASDQKYTYEVKKAPIDQKRILCEECWKDSLRITKNIKECEEKWKSSKSLLKNDIDFLNKWLEILEAKEKYEPYKPNTAIKNMLTKLINENA